jgi:hypothetical protein
VPNEIVIEAMIKGLIPGPTTQYFARKPPQTLEKLLQKMDEYICDGTSQVIRPTYSCPCLTDIRHPVDVPKLLDKFGIFPYLTRNVSPVLQTLQNIGDKEMRKRLHNLHLFKKQAQVVLLQTRTKKASAE